MLLTDLLPEISSKMPHNVAYKHGTKAVTYEEMLQRTIRIAGFLKTKGIRPGERIALLGDPSPELAAAEFAAIAVGAIPFVVFTALASTEINRILEDAAPAAIFYDRSKRDGIQMTEIGIRVCCDEEAPDPYIGEIWQGSSLLLPVSDWHRAQPGDPAVLIYTGGTTGKAKGVIHTHRSIGSWFNVSPVAGLGHAPHQKSVAFNMAHLTGQGVLWMTLAAGGCVHFLESYPAQAEQVMALVEREHITHLGTVGSLLRDILRLMERENRSLPSLKVVTCGGTLMSPVTLRKACELFPGAAILDVYSQTESGMSISMLSVNRCLQDGMPERLLSVGRPEAMSLFGQKPFELRIVDELGLDVHAGEAGEITVRGNQVMQGYWNNPAETAKALQDGWLRTGDIGYMAEDGFLYLVDRKKDMIIVSGANVFCSEVERVLEQHPAVQEAAVVGIPLPEEGEEVGAVVVPLGGADIPLDEIRLFCEGKLADFKIPAKWIQVSRLPRTSVDKVDKKKLREHFRKLGSSLDILPGEDYTSN